MSRWIRMLAPVTALLIVLGAALAALGGQTARADVSAAQAYAPAAPLPVPTATLSSIPGAHDGTAGQTGQADTGQEAIDDPENGTTAERTAGEEAAQAAHEAAEAAALAPLAMIRAQQARAAALAVNPGATIVRVELGDENGRLIYSVDLTGGAEVKVNARTGAMIGTDHAGSDQEQSGPQEEAAP